MIKQQDHQPQHQILGNWFLISSLLNQAGIKPYKPSFEQLKFSQFLIVYPVHGVGPSEDSYLRQAKQNLSQLLLSSC